MKNIILYIAVCSTLFIFSSSHAQTTLSGKITDKKTGETLPGVSVYFPDLKTGSITDISGSYKIENLPETKVLIQVHIIGYKLIAEQIDLAKIKEKNFAMDESVAELNEVVVTGLSHSAEKNRNPSPVTTITSIQLTQLSANNIIDAIATQPGISQITTGAGISKPVIRGLGYNRVVVVNDGIRQEGQQWGDEHGIEIDEYSVNHVEVIKGPASLAYGSDAMAGVINMLPAPTMPNGKIKGNVLLNYQTNNGLAGGSLNFTGNIKGLIWDLRYSEKMAHAYWNKYDGYVFNSGYAEHNLNGIAGVNKSWGYAHLHFSMYHLVPGIIEGERDSATGAFVKPFAQNDSTQENIIATKKDFLSYTPLTPYQHVTHYKAVLNNSFLIGEGILKVIAGWQRNQRQEYADILQKDQYGLYFDMNTFNYDFRYVFPEMKHYNLSFGVNGMYQHSQNKGTEYLIPSYHLLDAGIFALIRRSLEKWDISGGLRIDSRNEHGDDLWLTTDGLTTNNPDTTSYHKFVKFNRQFYGVSGSLGASYLFNENVFTKLNLSRGFRAPDIAELASNGIHEGTVNYITGTPSLKAENSLQLDYAVGVNTNHVSAEMDIFYNDIDNYIYLQKIPAVSGDDSLTDGYATFHYISGHAHIVGGEFTIDLHPHPLDWLHFENTFAYVHSVQAHQPDSMKFLPMTPAPKYTSELRAVKKKLGSFMANTYIKIGLEHYFNQPDFYAAFHTETATKGYTLLNFGAGADIVIKSINRFSIYITATNLTDVAYQSHLSRLKYLQENKATQRTGVFNMGRSVSFKIIIPLSIK